MVILLINKRFNPEWELSCRSFAVGLGPIPFVMIPEVSPANVSPIGPTPRKKQLIYRVNSFYDGRLSHPYHPWPFRSIVGDASPLLRSRADVLNQQGL
jgi:hypothetical protein